MIFDRPMQVILNLFGRSFKLLDALAETSRQLGKLLRTEKYQNHD